MNGDIGLLQISGFFCDNFCKSSRRAKMSTFIYFLDKIHRVTEKNFVTAVNQMINHVITTVFYKYMIFIFIFKSILSQSNKSSFVRRQKYFVT